MSLSSFASGKLHTYKADMSCMACAKNIQSALKDMNKKVTKFNADPEKDILNVAFEGENKPLTNDEIKQLLKISGYELVPVKK